MSRLVNLQYLNDYEYEKLKSAIANGMTDLCVDSKVKKGTVVIKANLSLNKLKDDAETTHPAIVRAVAEYFTARGCKCVLADCPIGKHSDSLVQSIYLSTGMLDMANVVNCELNSNMETVDIEIADGLKTKNAKVLKVIEEADVIINIGKLKFDENLGYLGAASNMFGVVAGEMKNVMLNRLISLADWGELIVDLNEHYKDKVVVNILDAIVCLEAGNTQRMLNCLAMGDSVYSIDAAMFDILDIKFANTYLKQARNRDLFDFKKPYRILGEKLDKFRVDDFSVFDYDLNKKLVQPKGYFKSHQERPIISKKLCKGCQICSKICPTGAIMMRYDENGELFAEIDYNRCIFCKKCVQACPYNVVEVKTPLGYKAIQKDVEKYNKEKN